MGYGEGNSASPVSSMSGSGRPLGPPKDTHTGTDLDCVLCGRPACHHGVHCNVRNGRCKFCHCFVEPWGDVPRRHDNRGRGRRKATGSVATDDCASSVFDDVSSTATHDTANLSEFASNLSSFSEGTAVPPPGLHGSKSGAGGKNHFGGSPRRTTEYAQEHRGKGHGNSYSSRKGKGRDWAQSNLGRGWYAGDASASAAADALWMAAYMNGFEYAYYNSSGSSLHSPGPAATQFASQGLVHGSSEQGTQWPCDVEMFRRSAAAAFKEQLAARQDSSTRHKRDKYEGRLVAVAEGGEPGACRD